MAQNYRKRRRTRRRRSPWLVPAAVIGAIVLVALIVVLVISGGDDTQKPGPGGNSNISVGYEDMEPIDLGQGLLVEKVGTYTGIYMEDGSNDTVSGVMMTIVKNTGHKDLQLARFTLEYDGFSAQFEATNLPSGERVVLLEKNRHAAAGKPQSAKLGTCVFFQEAMTLMEGVLELGGKTGSISVKNISGKDISGNIWVYYKYSATDLFYGGITFRAKHLGGLRAGQTVNIPAGHYSPSSVRLVWVTVGE